MFISESKSKLANVRKEKSEINNYSKYETNLTDKTKKSSSLSEPGSKMKKNLSVNGLYELKSGRELNPLKKVPS